MHKIMFLPWRTQILVLLLGIFFMYCSVSNTKGNLWLRFMSPQIEGALLLGLIDNIINHEPKYTQSYIMEDNSVR